MKTKKFLIFLFSFVVILSNISTYSFAESISNEDISIKSKVDNYILAKSEAYGNRGILLNWEKTKDASSYSVFGSLCGKKFKLIKEFKKQEENYSCKVLKINNKKLKKHTRYKFLISAYNQNGDVVASSRWLIIYTSNFKNKYGNVTSLSFDNGKNENDMKLGIGEHSFVFTNNKLLLNTYKTRNYGRINILKNIDILVPIQKLHQSTSRAE